MIDSNNASLTFAPSPLANSNILVGVRRVSDRKTHCCFTSSIVSSLAESHEAVPFMIANLIRVDLSSLPSRTTKGTAMIIYASSIKFWLVTKA